MITKRFLLFVVAFLLLGAAGFYIAVSTTPSPSSPFTSLPSEQGNPTDKSSSLSLSISDDPVVLEAEIKDTQLDTLEDDISDLDQELNSD